MALLTGIEPVWISCADCSATKLQQDDGQPLTPDPFRIRPFSWLPAVFIPSPQTRLCINCLSTVFESRNHFQLCFKA